MTDWSYATAEDWSSFWSDYDEEVNAIIAEHTEDKNLSDRIYEGFYKDEYDEFT